MAYKMENMSNFTDKIYPDTSVYFNIWKQKYYMKHYYQISHKTFGSFIICMCVYMCVYTYLLLFKSSLVTQMVKNKPAMQGTWV